MKPRLLLFTVPFASRYMCSSSNIKQLCEKSPYPIVPCNNKNLALKKQFCLPDCVSMASLNIQLYLGFRKEANKLCLRSNSGDADGNNSFIQSISCLILKWISCKTASKTQVTFKLHLAAHSINGDAIVWVASVIPFSVATSRESLWSILFPTSTMGTSGPKMYYIHCTTQKQYLHESSLFG